MADDHTPAADRLRPLRPSDVAVWAVGQLREITQGGTDFLVCIAVGAVSLWLLLPTQFVATTLVHSDAARVQPSSAWCCCSCWRIVQGASPGRPASERRRRVAGPRAGRWRPRPKPTAARSLACWEGFTRRPRQKGAQAVPDRWHSHNNLRDVLVRATVLPPVDDAGNPWTLGYRGPFDRNDYGEFQQIELPAPYTHEDVTKKRTRVARSVSP